jgi:biopolymer transport protein ExbD
MAGGFSSADDDVISGINVTPLVDVVLVLLIIFLITAPVLYQSAIKVQLPKAKSGEESPHSPLNFTLTKEGSLIWDKQPLDWKDLADKLKAMGPNISQETAMISADELTAHGVVIKLMDVLQQAGLTRFALNVEHTSGAPAPSSGNP